MRRILCAMLLVLPGAVFAAADEKAPEKLTAASLNQIWADFGRHDDEACLQALIDVDKLTKVPDLSVPFLGERLKSALAVDTSGVGKLIADLDSNDFATRDKAFKALEPFGSRALPLLERKLQEKDISLELQSSLKRLIQAAQSSDGKGFSADDLRALRGIEVLEAIATPAARAILEKLARGDEASPRTAAAQRALQALDRRAKGKS